MSDILSPVANLKFQDCINLTTDHSPKFVNKLSVDTTAVATAKTELCIAYFYISKTTGISTIFNTQYKVTRNF
jgi:hypothetical protein